MWSPALLALVGRAKTLSIPLRFWPLEYTRKIGITSVERQSRSDIETEETSQEGSYPWLIHAITSQQLDWTQPTSFHHTLRQEHIADTMLLMI